MKAVLKKLLTVKSLVTLAMTLVFCILSVAQIVSGDQFLSIFTTVIAFYFGTQYQKNETSATHSTKPEE